MPDAESVAITKKVTGVVPPEVVVRSPVLESMLTSVIELGFVVHVTELVTSTCCPFAVAVALNCSVDPYLMLVSVEVTLIAVIFASVTVMVAVPLTDPSATVITEVPGETPVTMPVVLSMVATVSVALLQKTPLPRAFVVPSSKLPVALIWTVLPC